MACLSFAMKITNYAGFIIIRMGIDRIYCFSIKGPDRFYIPGILHPVCP